MAAEESRRAVPGLGRAFLAMAAMVLIAAILCLLIYGLMVAISPIEPRRPAAAPQERGMLQSYARADMGEAASRAPMRARGVSSRA